MTSLHLEMCAVTWLWDGVSSLSLNLITPPWVLILLGGEGWAGGSIWNREHKDKQNMTAYNYLTTHEYI